MLNIRKALSVHDVQIVPARGRAPSRSDVEVRPFIFSAPMDTVTGYDLAKKMLDLGQYAVLSRQLPKVEIARALKDLGNNPKMFFAVGLDPDDIVFLSNNRGGEFRINVALDVAHGDMSRAHHRAVDLAHSPCVGGIMSGSICTPEAASRALDHGCNFLRVGVGPGSACTTRLMTGVGVPNFQAVYDIWEATRDMKRFIIADGGVKEPGDAAKYLAGGADAVMLGRALSRTRESAGWTEVPHPVENKLVKSFRGQASAKFQKDTTGHSSQTPEGISFPLMEWSGQTLEDVVSYYIGGVASSCSYAGHVDTIHMSPDTVKFVEVTNAGAQEGHPHKEV